MGATTIIDVGQFLKSRRSDVTIVGLQPAPESSIPGIREAKTTMRRLAMKRVFSAGVSSDGVVAGALRVAAEAPRSLVVTVCCDRRDRYLSTGVFDQPNATSALLSHSGIIGRTFHLLLARVSNSGRFYGLMDDVRLSGANAGEQWRRLWGEK